MGKDVYKKIRSLRKKLHKQLNKTGINSEETKKISIQIDELINNYYNSLEKIKYPDNSEIYEYYKIAIKKLKEVTEQLENFPTIEEWNSFAKKNNFISSVSIEYISGLNWNYLRVKILRELKMEI